ncbi:MAG TPA: HAD-IA family hydrolase [Rhodanobacteraceae bacterium]
MSGTHDHSRGAPVRYRAILFDLDGTLADTIPVCVQAFQRTFRRYAQRDYAYDEITAMFGPSEEGILQRRLPDRWQAALATYLAEYERLHANCPGLFAGLHPLLARLKRRGVRLGIVTAKGPSSARISARLLGLDAYFDGLEAGSAEGGSKPERMGRFLARWRLPVGDVAYVGDSPHDVDASRAAGVAAVAAAWAPGANATALAARHPDELFESVSAFDAWLARVT